jgi:hypothetical protein
MGMKEDLDYRPGDSWVELLEVAAIIDKAVTGSGPIDDRNGICSPVCWNGSPRNLGSSTVNASTILLDCSTHCRVLPLRMITISISTAGLAAKTVL